MYKTYESDHIEFWNIFNNIRSMKTKNIYLSTHTSITFQKINHYFTRIISKALKIE